MESVLAVTALTFSCNSWSANKGEGVGRACKGLADNPVNHPPAPSRPALPAPREAARESWVSVTSHLLNPLILLFLGGKALNIPFVFFFLFA